MYIKFKERKGFPIIYFVRNSFTFPLRMPHPHQSLYNLSWFARMIFFLVRIFKMRLSLSKTMLRVVTHFEKKVYVENVFQSALKVFKVRNFSSALEHTWLLQNTYKRWNFTLYVMVIHLMITYLVWTTKIFFEQTSIVLSNRFRI